MDCRFFEQDIALGADEDSDPALAEHLSVCTSCAEAVGEFSSLQSLFLSASEIHVPVGLVASVKSAVAEELRTDAQTEAASPSAVQMFLQQWLMPFSVAGAASVLITGSLLWLLLSGGGIRPEGLAHSPTENDSNEIVFLDTKRDPSMLNSSRVSAKELAASRTAVSTVSPSINPEGSIMSLASALTSGRIRGDEIVIVASILGDGSAELEKIVKPLDDQDVVFELQQAMSKKGDDSPFVPALLDNRSDDTTVVFRIQLVDVSAAPRRGKSR